jgi:hypothetical protein
MTPRQADVMLDQLAAIQKNSSGVFIALCALFLIGVAIFVSLLSANMTLDRIQIAVEHRE